MSEYKRLTGWDRGNPYVRECFERTAEEGGCEYMNTQKCIWCEHNLDTIRRLAQYEDSGFSPEQINTLLEKLAEALAGQEGQLTDRQIDAVLKVLEEAAEILEDIADVADMRGRASEKRMGKVSAHLGKSIYHRDKNEGGFR